MVQEQPIRILFYVQHLLGIGHLMRARHLVLALRDNHFDVTLVTGGAALSGFDVPRVKHVSLPSIAVSGADFRELVDANGQQIDDTFKQKRCDMLLETYRAAQPDVVMLEAFPFGRRQVRFELMPLINAIESSSPKPLLLSSIRDILQKRIKPDRDIESAILVQTHFDRVLVHGDPVFARLASSFSQAAAIADQVVYTGLVCGPKPELASREFDIVVSAGGGAVGEKLVSASIEAACQLPDTGQWCVITGPNLPEQDFVHLNESAPAHVGVERFRSDFPSLLAGAQLSISQAGYNTVSDVLQAGCRSILIPFSSGGETEQADRAQRLKDLGLATVMSDEQLSAQQLALNVQMVLSQTTPLKSVDFDVDGANNTARIIRKLADEKQSVCNG